MLNRWALTHDFITCSQRSVLMVLLLLGLSACNQDNTHKMTLYVYPDSTGKNALFVNDQPVETFQKNRGSGPVRAEIYEPYYYVKSLEPRFHLVIKAGGAPLYETSVEPGSYVANVSSDHSIWIQEIAYGRQLGADAQFLDRGELGVYLLGKDLFHVVFQFDQEPPESVTRRRGTGASTEYFILGTSMEKGIALRKKLAAQYLEKHKDEIEATDSLRIDP